jgi:hypothetical protein
MTPAPDPASAHNALRRPARMLVRLTIRHPVRRDDCTASANVDSAVHVGEIVAWLQDDNLFGPWLDPVPLGIAYGAELPRTGARLMMASTLLEAGIVHGDLIQIVRLNSAV